MFQSFLSPISTGWNNANEEYNKVFHPNDYSKTNQNSLANIAVGVGAGLGVGVGIIALAPVIGVSVGGALGIGAVCLTTTAIGAGIGVAIGFIPQEEEKSKRMHSASQDRSPDSPRSQESAENAQAYTADNFSNQIKENFKSLADLLTGNGNTNASPEKSKLNPLPQHFATKNQEVDSSTQKIDIAGAFTSASITPLASSSSATLTQGAALGPVAGGGGKGVAGGNSPQVLQAPNLGEQSKVAGAGAGTERLQQATQIKEVDTSKPPVAESSLSPSTQVREVDNKTGEQGKLGAALGSVTGGGGNGSSTSVSGAALPAVDAGGSSSLQGSQQAPHAQSGAVELSTVGPAPAEMTAGTHSPQNSVAPESPPIPDNTQAASSPSTQGGATYDGSPATSPVAAVVSNKQPIIEFKSGSDKQPSSSPITSKGLGSNSSCWPVLFGSSRA